ncbi:MAG TPA: hypothetical protein VF479_00875 [Pseudolysinimonas sp.]
MSTTPESTTPSTPSENVPRGTLLALLIIPAGIIVWVIVWGLGFIASIVALGIAIGALWLYRLGSGGRISRAGAVRVTVITVVALLLAFWAGLVSDALPFYASQRNIDYISALTSGDFWSLFNHAVANNFGEVAGQFAIALAFGALGCFSVLRTAFVQTRAADAATAAGTMAPPISPTITPAPAPAPETDPNADKRD